jgi:cell division protein FtsI/penicillin-binding protein 2
MPAAFLGLFALIVLGRLIQVQVLEHDAYAARAARELRGSTTFYAERGTILDRNGHVLAISVDTWDIYVNSRAWRDIEAAGPAAEALGAALGAEPYALRQKVVGSELVDVLVARDVPYEVGRSLLDDGIRGVVALPNSERIHPEGDLGGSVLGITGLDNTGLAGLEAALDDVLKGRPGRAIFERDTSGEPIPFGQYVAIDPIRGEGVVLTIDRYLQQMAETMLAEAIQEHRASGGAIIIVDPYTMDILALASSPGLTYSNLDLDDPEQLALLRNRAVTDAYEPGSVMKVVTTSAAIDAGLVSPDTTYVDTGVTRIYDTEIQNWDYNVYGEQTMTGVLQHSINTGAVFMVEMLGEERFHQYLDAFGFGRPTGIELTGEATGILRRPNDPDWSPVDLATQSFGQAISVTPMQMISAVAAAINGGVLMRPHLVKAYIGSDGERREVEPVAIGRAISEETSATMRQMLAAVVDPGWYHPGKPRDYSAGGKSGTANVPIPNGSYNDNQVASFIGFAPADDPEILVLVKLDENQDLLTGTQAAGPIFAKLADQALHYLNVTPDSGTYAVAP